MENPAYKIADKALRFGLRLIPPSRAAEHIALWWGYRYRPGAETVRLRSGGLISVSEVEHSQLLMRYIGTFEPDCLAYLRKYATPGATVLDVGANVGLYTIEASRAVGPHGRVIAIEASPQHAKTIQRSIQLNQINNATLLNVAVGSEPGEAVLTMPSDGNQGMFTLGDVPGSSKCTVPVQRIDDILSENGITKVDFIKMDIEGSEYNALIGARDTIERSYPPILIELNEAALRGCGSSARALKELLTLYGYRGFLIDGKRLLPIEPQQEHVCDECLFLHGS